MTFQKFLPILSQDPGLPSTNPTKAYWQMPSHPTLSTIQSHELPGNVDYAVIGSGITGCSIVKHLLENEAVSNESNVCVFEARTICSGATGRNGGGLASFVPFDFLAMCETYGTETAMDIARFTYQNLDKIHDIGNSDDRLRSHSEIRRTREVMGFQDIDTFEAFKQSILSLQEMVPEANLQVEVVEADAALKELGVKTIGGAICYNSGAFWPYRFVTSLWSKLVEAHQSRLSIETNTPVTDVTFNSANGLYALQTPRGVVRAKKILHATNAFTSHLIPSLRDKIFPVRGYMSAQQPGSNFGNHGHNRSWSSFGAATYDAGVSSEAEDMLDFGIYYGNMSPNEDTMFWGCDATPTNGWITADDSIVPDRTRKRLSTVLPTQFTGWKNDEKPVVRGMWSGILGYTADNLPLVGGVLPEMAGRGVVGGEWICAGFNGAGMCQCWSSGEAVVKMMLGQSVKELIPVPYLMSRERLSKPEMNSRVWAENMLPSEVTRGEEA